MGRGTDIVPIPGTKRLAYLRENIGAVEVRLTVEETRLIDEVFPPGVASGDRYAPAQMQRLGR